MIRINAIGILALLLFAAIVACGYPLWAALAELVWPLVETTWQYEPARYVLLGVLIGLFASYGAGWNDALRLRKGQMHDRAEEEYQRDKRRIL